MQLMQHNPTSDRESSDKDIPHFVRVKLYAILPPHDCCGRSRKGDVRGRQWGLAISPAYCLAELAQACNACTRKTGMNIYIGNISFQATADDLRELFEQYGAVKNVTVITD